MSLINRVRVGLAAIICAVIASNAMADRGAYLNLARQGWSYELRTTMVGRNMAIPVEIHGRNLSGAAICIVGEEPHPLTADTLTTFLDLLNHTFGKRVPMRFAGADARGCGAGRTVVLRLYSGLPPNVALSADLNWMNDVYALGLPRGRGYAATSPAMAQTFFGRHGQGTHIMVKQPAFRTPDQVERAFYKSILIEELFQTFTFGMDVLLFEREAAFTSKLQERPTNLSRMSWASHDFMRALLHSNPRGLCRFDLFMLHAVARAPVAETVHPDFIAYIEDEFETLVDLATATWTDPRFRSVLDAECDAPGP